MKKLILLIALFATQAHAVCTSPISRTNNTANQVLTSTKYNLDLNTVYSKVNNLPGDCITDETITTDKIADEAVTAAKIDGDVLAKFIPAGTILPFGGTVVPTGFLLCNGQQVSRTTYSDLYAVIGNNFGSGNGSTTFHVPDFRGRFLRGVDGGAARDPNRTSRTAMNSGGNTADNVGSIQGDMYEEHRHSYTTGRDGSSVSSKVSNLESDGGINGTAYSSYEGGDETRPINAGVHYIIKY